MGQAVVGIPHHRDDKDDTAMFLEVIYQYGQTVHQVVLDA